MSGTRGRRGAISRRALLAASPGAPFVARAERTKVVVIGAGLAGLAAAQALLAKGAVMTGRKLAEAMG